MGPHGASSTKPCVEELQEARELSAACAVCCGQVRVRREDVGSQADVPGLKNSELVTEDLREATCILFLSFRLGWGCDLNSAVQPRFPVLHAVRQGHLNLFQADLNIIALRLTGN